jgi:8-oxo-dGTP pyrophosphatase MutT (NUDIX family)
VSRQAVRVGHAGAVADLRSLLSTDDVDVERVLALVDRGDDVWSRAAPLHLTGSALVVHPATGRVLLRWHERQGSWLQVGGHGDPGETDPYVVALREAAEETGLSDLRPFPGPAPRIVHLVVVPVPAGKDEPAHEHADVRYLLATDAPGSIRAEDDSAPLRWCTLDEARELTGEDNLRVTLDRAAALLT